VKNAPESEKLKFLYSSFSTVSKRLVESIHMDLREYLELVDTVLMKLFINLDQETKLRGLLFDEDQSSCNLEEGEEYLVLQMKTKTKSYAFISEKRGQISQALDTWRSLHKDRSGACEETIRILKGCVDKKVVIEYSRWILSSFPEKALELFTAPDEKHHLSADSILELLSEFEQNSRVPLKELYLENLVFEKKSDIERFHTQLAVHYVTKLFQERDHDDTLTDQEAEQMSYNKDVQRYRRKLNRILHDSKFYRPKKILEKIRGSWLFKEEIYLYSILNMHDEALSLLVENSEKTGDYSEPENYCTGIAASECSTGNLLSRLIKIYIKFYNDTTTNKSTLEAAPIEDEELQNRIDSLTVQAAKYQKRVLSLLQKYSFHNQLNPLEVIDILPDYWKLSATDGDSNSLLSYLTSTMQNYVHKQKNTKIARQLAEMEQLQVECQWIKARRPYVRITPERTCDVCKRKINDKVFVVYPNGVTTHHTCIQDTNVCPVTGENFKATFLR